MLSSRKSKRYPDGSLNAHEAAHVSLVHIATGRLITQRVERKDKQEEHDDTSKQTFGMK